MPRTVQKTLQPRDGCRVLSWLPRCAFQPASRVNVCDPCLWPQMGYSLEPIAFTIESAVLLLSLLTVGP